ncbi:MAG: putative Ig domain-containing protein [Myxococcales bacterium]|nr:putative Ig domain-containing protein [Myxococcales bacterium]
MRAWMLLCVGLVACNEEFPSQPAADAAAAGPCVVGEAICVNGRARVCLEDESGWLETACGAGERCSEGACVALACAPGARVCGPAGVQICAADGLSQGEPTPCGADETCLEGVCLPRQCQPGEVACGEGGLLTCEADGLRWSRQACAAGEVCAAGRCGPPAGADCEPGRTLCGEAEVVVCGPDGWTSTPCAAGQACFLGRCVDCVQAADCGPDAACVDGACASLPLAITTAELPAGQVDRPYDAALAAAGGEAPITWRVAEGGLPAGLALDPATGAIAGVPTEAGGSVFTVAATDADGVEATAELALTILAPGLGVATERLPVAEQGEPYEARLAALGGEGALGWFLVDGALPAGLLLTADGLITGIPEEIGEFALRVRVVDAATPPAFAEADLTLRVQVAPLVIVGDQVVDLIITRIVTLPGLVVIPGVPIPYDARLTARGGLPPYTWAEDEIPPAARPLLPQAGIPAGLVLEADGRLHGTVEDPASAVEVVIPFTQIRLSGFFFFAEVRDSQAAPARASAIFLLPTIPLGP